MATQVQNRRGTTAEHSTFTGAVGEVTIDTDKDTVVVHDGSTAGGRALLREDGTNSALALGSAGTPSLKFTGDTNTGIYSPGADQVAISTNGTGRLFINSSGQVGVGTSTVSQRLHVGDSAGNPRIRIESYSGSQNAGVEIGAVRDDVSTSKAQMRFYTDNGSGLQTAVTIDASQRLGVGSTAPTRLLTVQSTGNADICIKGPNTSTSQLLFGDTDSDTPGVIAYNHSTNNMVFEVNAAERARIDSSGRLGIGTSSPSTALHAFSTGTEWLGQFGNITANGSNVRIRYNAIGAFAANSVASNLLLNPDGGAVGIGTTSPQNQLHLVGSSTANYIRLENSTGLRTYLAVESAASVIYAQNNAGGDSPLAFATGSTERARIDASGRLLVGTSSSASQGCALQVRSDIGVNAEFFRSADNSGGPYIALTKTRGTAASPTEVSSGDDLGTIDFLGYDGATYRSAATIQAQADGTWTDGGDTTDNPGRLVFSTTADGASSPTERMRINSNGQLCINTTTATTGIGHRVFIEDGTTYAPMGVNNAAGGTSSSNNVVIYRAGTQVGSITTTNTATAYNTSSDYRLKENITEVTDGIARLQQLKPSRFNFIGDAERTVDGFIAHEVQDVVPEAVHGAKDEVDADGKPIYQGIDQSKLVPLLTAALQEALGEIESLKARLTAAGI